MSSGRNWRGGRDNGAGFPTVFPILPTEDIPWWLIEGRVITRPSSSIRPIIYESPPRIMVQRNNMQVPPTQQVESRLNQEDQKAALKKLKTEIYNPMPKKISKRVNLYYRDNGRTSNNEKEREIDEDGKRCAICLDDFEPKEEVMLTPCNHMFHEDCIVPWVKSHGQCPVCRFVLCEKMRESTLPLNNNNNNNADMVDLDLLVGAMGFGNYAGFQRLLNL